MATPSSSSSTNTAEIAPATRPEDLLRPKQTSSSSLSATTSLASAPSGARLVVPSLLARRSLSRPDSRLASSPLKGCTRRSSSSSSEMSTAVPRDCGCCESSTARSSSSSRKRGERLTAAGSASIRFVAGETPPSARLGSSSRLPPSSSWPPTLLPSSSSVPKSQSPNRLKFGRSDSFSSKSAAAHVSVAVVAGGAHPSKAARSGPKPSSSPSSSSTTASLRSFPNTASPAGSPRRSTERGGSVGEEDVVDLRLLLRLRLVGETKSSSLSDMTPAPRALELLPPRSKAARSRPSLSPKVRI